MKLPSKPRVTLLVLLGGVAAVTACGPTFRGEDETAGRSGSVGLSGTAGSEMGGAPNAGSNNPPRGGGGGKRQGIAGDGGRGGSTVMAGRGGEGATTAGSDAGGTGNQGGSGADAGSSQGGRVAEAGTSALGGGGASAGGGVSAGNGGINASGGLAGVAGTGLGGSVGGVAGSSGTLPCQPASKVDDMEDGDDQSCPNQGRSGEWWAATGTLTGIMNPPEAGEFPAFPLAQDARPGSVYGMRLSGQNFGQTEDDWASLGFYLAGGAAYDLSAYQGLAFYAKSRASALTVHVKIATDPTAPTSEGGTCVEDCNDHYRATVTLDATWREFSVPFATLAQEGWGEKPKDLAHALFVYFGYLGTDRGPAAFDFLIDDVRVY